MNRNVNKVMDKIFEVLKDSLSDEDKNRVQNYKRHIKASGEEEKIKEIVQRAKILYTQEKYSVNCITYSDDMFILFPTKYREVIRKVEIGEFMEKSIEEDYQKELYQGMGMLAIAEGVLKTKLTISSLQIYDKCLGLPEDENCFDFFEICELFEDYSVVKVNLQIFPLVYKEDMVRFIALLQNTSDLAEDNSNNLNALLLLCGSRGIAWNILNYMNGNIWEYKFLQVYQCLEYLFIVVAAKELEDKYNIDEKKAINIATDNSFKISEKDNLIKTIKFCSDLEIEEYYKLLKTYPSFVEKTDEKKSCVADHIYRLRCNIAHLRFKQDNVLGSINKEKELTNLIIITLKIYIMLDDKICKYNEIMNNWELLVNIKS